MWESERGKVIKRKVHEYCVIKSLINWQKIVCFLNKIDVFDMLILAVGGGKQWAGT